MTADSTRLSVTPVGRAVAQSVLHPRSADQLIEYSARRANDLLALTQDEAGERTLRYALLHAAYSSDEYSIRGSARNLPYQLDNLVQNTLADQSEAYLLEHPWQRNPPAANAAMLAIRWADGRPRNDLAPEFPVIGSGVSQTMIREGAEILFAWSDCLIAATAPHLVDNDRPLALRADPALLRALRNLASVIRVHARMLAAGLPGDVAWMAGLAAESTGRRLLSRPAILALLNHGLTDPVDLLRHDNFGRIIAVLKPTGISDLDAVVKDFRNAVRIYRQDRRKNLWEIAIDRAPDAVRVLLKETIDTRGKAFERKVEALLDAVGIAYERLDDGKTPGAADLHVGLNYTIQVVSELKTAEGEGTVGLNDATDVIKGAAIVKLAHLPKVTLANPGFDPNVPWQARNVKDLALVEACQFAYGISLLARGEIDKDAFLDWLAQPGMLSVSQLRGSQTGIEY
jgi:hypothetical protein